MKYSGLVFAAGLGALVVTGCAKNIDNKEAVQDGVRKGVAKRGIDPNQMDVNVTSVQFHGNTADATVSFAAKGQPAGGGVTVNYELERVKDEWVVKTRAPLSTMGHTQGSELPGKGGSAGAMGNLATSPDGHMSPSNGGKEPLDKGFGAVTDSGGAQVPPGHPAVANPHAAAGSGTTGGTKQ